MFEWYEWIFITICVVIVSLLLEGIVSNICKTIIIKKQDGKGEDV